MVFREGASVAWMGVVMLSASAQDAPGKVWIETRDGATVGRPVAALESRVGMGEGVVSMRFEGLPPNSDRIASGPTTAECAFASGDRVRARVIGGDGDRVDLALAGGTTMSVDVEQLARLVFPARADANVARTFEAAPSGDRLFWARGESYDKVDGTLEAFGPEGLRFDSKLAKKDFAWSEIAALYIEALAAPVAPPPDAARVIVDLLDQGRLRGRLTRLDALAATLEFEARRTIVLPLNTLAELTLDDGSVAFLSSFAPAKVVEGYFADDEVGMRWPFQVDASVLGAPLRAGGRLWPRGLGVHAPSRLEFALDGAWRTLRGNVAIDDSVLLLPYKGSVEFEVYLGGTETPAWRSGRVRGGDAPIALPAIDLTGVNRISLVVTMDERAFVADRADWLRLLLVR